MNCSWTSLCDQYLRVNSSGDLLQGLVIGTTSFMCADLNSFQSKVTFFRADNHLELFTSEVHFGALNRSFLKIVIGRFQFFFSRVY